MNAVFEALKVLAGEAEPHADMDAVDRIIAQSGGDAREAAISLLRISRTLAFELHVLAELRSYEWPEQPAH